MSSASPSRSFQLLFWGGLVLAWILNATVLQAPEPDEGAPRTPKPSQLPSANNTKVKAVSPQRATLDRFDEAKDKTGETQAVAPEPAPIPICASNQRLVPGGIFSMGSADGEEDEAPEHEVTLSEFCLDTKEVTVAEYRSCVEAGACSAGFKTAQRAGYGLGYWKQWDQFCHWSSGPEMDQHPMNCVDWKQATAYCTWKGSRLPTEAEWEFAARGNSRHKYPWGDEAPSPLLANGCGDECVDMAKKTLRETWARTYKGDDGWPTTAPVGSFPKGASPFGILDLAGNVWEWTLDSYSRYPREATTNPRQSKGDNTPRVCRGGGWSNFRPARITSTQRAWHLPDSRIGDLGFRCAR